MVSMSDLTDPLGTRPSLLSAMARQDDQAWAEFDRIYGPVLRGAAERRGLNRDEAQDVYQQVLLEIYQQIGSLDRRREVGRGLFRAWLFIKTRWRSEDLRKRRLPRHEADAGDASGTGLMESLPDLSAPLPDQASDLELAREIDSRIRHQLAQTVDTKQLRAFCLRRYENWSAHRVAEHLGVKSESVDVWVHRVQERYNRELAQLVKRLF